MTTPATCARAREIAAREHAALAHLTDAQALATWERMKAVRKAYVEAIIARVPSDRPIYGNECRNVGDQC